MKDAARRQGIVNAGVNIGPLPEECGTDTPHAALIKGESKLNTLDRERIQLNKANASKRRCNNVHNEQATALSAKTGAQP